MRFPFSKSPGSGLQATFHFRSLIFDDEEVPVGPPLSGLARLGVTLLPAVIERADSSYQDVVTAGNATPVPAGGEDLAPSSPTGEGDGGIDADVAAEVQRSLKALAAHSKVVGRAFFALFFARRPDLMRLFGFRNDPNFLQSRGLKVHAKAIMGLIGRAVRGGVAPLLPELQRLGRRHLLSGVPHEAFEDMREAFLESLSGSLGSELWTTGVEAAWRSVFDAIAAAIKGNYEFTGGVGGAASVVPYPTQPELEAAAGSDI